MTKGFLHVCENTIIYYFLRSRSNAGGRRRRAPGRRTTIVGHDQASLVKRDVDQAVDVDDGELEFDKGH